MNLQKNLDYILSKEAQISLIFQIFVSLVLKEQQVKTYISLSF